MNVFVNLNHYYNHAVFYNHSFEDSQGNDYDDIYRIAGVSLVGQPSDLNVDVYNCPFRCGNNVYNNFDNVVCEGQTVDVDFDRANRLCILGFCDYGTVRDTLTITTLMMKIKCDFILKTFHTFDYQAINDSEENEKCKLARKLRGSDGQKRNIYFWEINMPHEIIGPGKIVLPFNPSLHILAMTLQ